MPHSHVKIVLACAAAAFIACGGSKPPEATSQLSTTSMQGGLASNKETPTQSAQSGSIHIADEILRACGIPDADAYFPFDSSRLDGKDLGPLNAVATCFSTGPMKGHSMKLIGRADPRGEVDYNMTLGQARADSVQKYVVNKGVDRSMAQSTSRGAMDATGTDEAGWARDRRVDIMLGS